MRCGWPKLPPGPVGLGGLVVLGFFAVLFSAGMVLLIAAYINAAIQLLLHGRL